MNFYRFLRNEEPDFKGRYLSDILNFTDDEIETKHDFIQLLFPLNKPSRSVLHGHYLKDKKELNAIKDDVVIKTNIIQSANWFMAFLERNSQWMTGHDHNQLRITRVIESLRLLVSDQEADGFYQQIILLLDDHSRVNKTTLAFWSNA